MLGVDKIARDDFKDAKVAKVKEAVVLFNTIGEKSSVAIPSIQT